MPSLGEVMSHGLIELERRRVIVQKKGTTYVEAIVKNR